MCSLRESAGLNQTPGSAPQPCVQREGKAHSFPWSISLPLTSQTQPYWTGAAAKSHGKRGTDELKSSANKIITNNCNFHGVISGKNINYMFSRFSFLGACILSAAPSQPRENVK